jgi:hypothetical protein
MSIDQATPPLRSPSRGIYSPPPRRFAPRRPSAPKQAPEQTTSQPGRKSSSPGRGSPPAKSSASTRLVLTRRGRRLALETAAMLASTALAVALPSSLQATRPWSEPAVLAACSAPGRPAVLFPADEPRHGTGPGAVVWGASGICPGGAGARVSAIVPTGDVPRPAYAPRGARGRPLGLAAPIAAESAPYGRILLAGTSGPRRAGRGGGAGGLRLSEGSAGGGPFTTPSATGGSVTGGSASPLALTSAYLGDVALVSPGGRGGGRLELRIHRYYMGSFSPSVAVTGGHGVETLAVAMDYRSDALVAWERAGTVVARDMPQSERSGQPAERVAPAYPGAHIAAILSDDDRAILAWSETHDGVTSVYVELSGTGVRWGTPRLLERFTDPGGHAPAGGGGAPRLVRLASESVMLAWSGVSAGLWVVHTAAVDENGVRTIDTISSPGRDAVLDDLAPGPGDEAYALWSEPRAGASGESGDGEQALYAARGIDAYPGRTIFTAPERIAAAGASGADGDEAAVGVDPDSDRAIAAWRTSGGAIDYSLRGLGG